jgi:hypothetical protein
MALSTTRGWAVETVARKRRRMVMKRLMMEFFFWMFFPRIPFVRSAKLNNSDIDRLVFGVSLGFSSPHP